MKSVSIIAIALFALVALCSSVPVVNQQVEDEARIDIYNDFLAGLFSGLVQTTFGTVSGFLNQLITENPLGIGKRDVDGDLAARIDFLSFLYDNILQDFFSGIVTNTFTTATNALNNLIQTNPLGVGKRDVDGDLTARIDALSFLYDNILQDFFSGIVSNTFNTLSSTLLNLISTNPLGVGKRDVQSDLTARIDALSFLYDNILQDFFSGIVSNTFNTLSSTLLNLISTNPLGVGKRDIEGDLVARIDALSFLYDNILQDLFSGLVSNTFNTLSSTLLNLISTNPLGIGKRAAGNVNVFQFLYDNVVADLFGGLASNTANYLQNSLNNLLNKPFANVGKRSVNIQQAQTIIAQTVATLIEQFKTFAHQAVASWNDRQKLNQLVKDNIAVIKATVSSLAQHLAEFIPSAITTEVSEVLATLQSVLIFWTSGLGGSLGPVIGPFRA